MRSNRTLLPSGLIVAIVLVGSAIWGLRAQEFSPARAAHRPRVDEAMARPYNFTFEKDTTLTDVASKLQAELGFQTTLDIAGLQRAGISPDDHVRLVLKDVRLKTGLKLLLDQVGLTARVVAEDNLLVITDLQGAEESNARLLSEVKELHRDIHELQDAVDDLAASLGHGDDGPGIKKPIIIEEVPVEGVMPEEKPREKGGEKDEGPGKGGDSAGRVRPGL